MQTKNSTVGLIILNPWVFNYWRWWHFVKWQSVTDASVITVRDVLWRPVLAFRAGKKNWFQVCNVKRSKWHGIGSVLRLVYWSQYWCRNQNNSNYNFKNSLHNTHRTSLQIRIRTEQLWQVTWLQYKTLSSSVSVYGYIYTGVQHWGNHACHLLLSVWYKIIKKTHLHLLSPFDQFTGPLFTDPPPPCCKEQPPPDGGRSYPFGRQCQWEKQLREVLSPPECWERLHQSPGG